MKNEKPKEKFYVIKSSVFIFLIIKSFMQFLLHKAFNNQR
jgi:hypothetical protein